MKNVALRTTESGFDGPECCPVAVFLDLSGDEWTVSVSVKMKHCKHHKHCILVYTVVRYRKMSGDWLLLGFGEGYASIAPVASSLKLAEESM